MHVIMLVTCSTNITYRVVSYDFESHTKIQGTWLCEALKQSKVNGHGYYNM